MPVRQTILPCEEFKLTEAEIELLPLVEAAYEASRVRRLMMSDEKAAYDAVKACMRKHRVKHFNLQGYMAELEEEYELHIAAEKEE